MRICRLDAFLTGYEVRFLEFNADSPAVDELDRLVVHAQGRAVVGEVVEGAVDRLALASRGFADDPELGDGRRAGRVDQGKARLLREVSVSLSRVAVGVEQPLALFQDPRFAHLVEGDGAEVVQETIPWTRVLRPGKRFNINPFGIGGRHAGSITRISDQAVINLSAGGALLPSVIGRHKRRLLAEEDEQEEVAHGL